MLIRDFGLFWQSFCGKYKLSAESGLPGLSLLRCMIKGVFINRFRRNIWKRPFSWLNWIFESHANFFCNLIGRGLDDPEIGDIPCFLACPLLLPSCTTRWPKNMYDMFYLKLPFSYQTQFQPLLWFAGFVFISEIFFGYPVIWLGVHCRSDSAVWVNVLQPWSDFRWIVLFRADPWQFLLILSNIGRTMMTTCFSLGSAVTASFLQKWKPSFVKAHHGDSEFLSELWEKYDCLSVYRFCSIWVMVVLIYLWLFHPHTARFVDTCVLNRPSLTAFHVVGP